MDTQSLLQHSNFIRGLARALVRDPWEAEDLIQDTWLTALKSPPDDTRSVRAWLVRVMRNRLVSRYRHDTRRRQREVAAAQREDLPSADDMAERESTCRLLVEAVFALPEPYRSMIVYRFYDGLSAAEIARRERMPVETVRTRVKRGLSKLRAALEHERGGQPRAWSVALLGLAGVPEASGTGSGAASIVGPTVPLVHSVSTGALLMSTKTIATISVCVTVAVAIVAGVLNSHLNAARDDVRQLAVERDDAENRANALEKRLDSRREAADQREAALQEKLAELHGALAEAKKTAPAIRPATPFRHDRGGDPSKVRVVRFA